MEIEQLNLQLKDLAKLEPKDAQKGVSTLIEDLLKADTFYILSDYNVSSDSLESKSFLPYMAPAYDGGCPYIRLFTHQEAAEQFIKKEGNPHCICKMDTIEMVRFSKYWFLLGIDGFILNDGQIWTNVSFYQVLSIFFTKILQAPEAMDSAYLDSIRFTSQIRQGKEYFFTKEKNTIVVSNKGKSPLTLEKWYGFASKLNIKNICFPSDNPEQKVTISSEQLRMLLKESKTIGADVESFKTIDQHSIYDFSVLMPYLVFDNKEQFIWDEKKVEPEKKSEEIIKPVVDSIRKTISKPHKKKILKISFGVMAAFVIVFAILFAGMLSDLSIFKKDVTNNSFAEATEIYQKYSNNEYFTVRAEPCVSEKIETTLQKYKDEKIEDQGVETIYTNIAPLGCADTLQKAKSDFYLIKNSRIAYKNGLNVQSSIQKLYFWKTVSKIDTKNYSSANSDFAKNKDGYLTNALTLITVFTKYKKTEDISRVFNVLDYWYPNDKFVADAKKAAGATANYDVTQPLSDTSLFANNNSNQNGNKALEISKLGAEYNEERDYTDLYISWTNCSGKTLKEVDFYVLPIANDGDVAETSTPYQLYCARDVGPYANGSGTPSGDWAWKNVWAGNKIVSVNLMQIIIIYQDGSIQTVDNDVSLQNMIA